MSVPVRISRIADQGGTMTQECYLMLLGITQRLDALEARSAAAAGVAAASGGAVVDTEARAELTALKAALNGQ